MGNLGGKEERGKIMNIGKPGTVGIKWTGVDILPHAPINILETNKHVGKRWKGNRKIQHLSAT